MTEPTHDSACPRCGTAREPAQEYCLECGLKLPATTGRLARARRGWVRRIGWYPGDSIWTTLLALVVAAGGAAVAIVATNPASGGNTGTEFVATTPTVPLTTPATTFVPTVDTSTLPIPPEPRATTTAPAPPKNGATPWPAGAGGWTVVLVSLPAGADGRAAARRQADRAVENGLPEVGVLVSSRYASLHPGYLVVFAGIYDARGEAESSLPAARSAGFSGAYVRQITQ